MATMKDVARLAGVSTSTVSHVINGNRYVSDNVKKKVNAAIEELNYAPSALARSLKIKQTKPKPLVCWLQPVITLIHQPKDELGKPALSNEKSRKRTKATDFDT
ncbi:hypothetical protein AFK69_04295 [Xenorhabdus sp. GDc328]|nr:hypothetical protein AAY47_14605 [Xenorhabdus griffiniae]KOP34468.1 hypothetical protein AFK69_04295 [Xenorhabdus sp. GDc328]